VRKAFARSPSAAKNGSLVSSAASFGAASSAPTERSAGALLLNPRGVEASEPVGEEGNVFDKVRTGP